jgi:hypothetical protein
MRHCLMFQSVAAALSAAALPAATSVRGKLDIHQSGTVAIGIAGRQTVTRGHFIAHGELLDLRNPHAK